MLDRFTTTFWTLIVTNLAGSVLAGDIQPECNPKAAPASLPPLAAKFKTTVAFGDGERRVSFWYLWRENNRVETRQAVDPWSRVRGLGEVSEVWERLPNSEVSQQRRYHKEKRILEFTPGDLRMLGLSRGWIEAACLADYNALQKRLQRKGPETHGGRPAEIFDGKIGEVSYEVIWLGDQQICARISEKRPSHDIQIELLEIHSLGQEPWTRLDVVDDYIVFDYADLGDMEEELDLQRLIHNYRIPHRSCKLTGF